MKTSNLLTIAATSTFLCTLWNSVLTFTVSVNTFPPKNKNKSPWRTPLLFHLTNKMGKKVGMKDFGYDDDVGAAEMLPLSTADIARLAEMRSRHRTLPIMILDAMLPGQCLQFGSSDLRFRKLVEHVLEDGCGEIGMIGLNPHTGRPLNIGVTCSVAKEQLNDQFLSTATPPENDFIAISIKGGKRFEVQGEPRMDDTQSFYLADIEIVEYREESMSQEQDLQAKNLSEKIPDLVEQWLGWVLKSGKSDRVGMERRLQDIGPMPEEIGTRAVWIGALVNPLPALGVCLEIRPAMLACKNDLERIGLATTAIQSSIDHLSGKRKLF